ncbi:MAG TPA: TetR/AcrR family transcriptional regulator [Caulobacteraceae bacterium]
MSSGKSRPPTREALIKAAAAAFNAHGFHGTDTNKIARSAGFAPQTFYRHFTDKLAIFIAVYEAWQASEREAVRAAARDADPDVAIARTSVAHHRDWRGFRRSLRLLALEEPRIRAARAESRERQLADLAKAPGNRGRSKAELTAALLKVERICDALADDEFADIGISVEEAEALAVEAIRQARGR